MFGTGGIVSRKTAIAVQYYIPYVYMYGTLWFINPWFCNDRRGPVGRRAC